MFDNTVILIINKLFSKNSPVMFCIMFRILIEVMLHLNRNSFGFPVFLHFESSDKTPPFLDDHLFLFLVLSFVRFNLCYAKEETRDRC